MYFFSLLVATSLSLFPVEIKLEEIQQIDNSAASHLILFMRHGESEFNVPNQNGIKFTSGKSLTISLTEKGLKQAEDIGIKLIGKLNPAENYVILSSTALRAQQTADRIFEQLKPYYSIERGESYEGLCERGQGIWEGQPRDEHYDIQVKKWEELSAKEKFFSPMLTTGEAYNEVAFRSLQDLHKIVEKYPNQTIIIVSHYAAMNALALQWTQPEHLSEAPRSPLPSLKFNNCDILKVEIPKDVSVDKAQMKMHIKSEV